MDTTTCSWKELKLFIEPSNIPSIKLVEKQGFNREGLLRHYEFTCGKFEDLYMYSMIKEDFTSGL